MTSYCAVGDVPLTRVRFAGYVLPVAELNLYLDVFGGVTFVSFDADSRDRSMQLRTLSISRRWTRGLDEGRWVQSCGAKIVNVHSKRDAMNSLLICTSFVRCVQSLVAYVSVGSWRRPKSWALFCWVYALAVMCSRHKSAGQTCLVGTDW